MIQASNENYGRNDRNSNNEDITSETMETKDPAINQHTSSGNHEYRNDNSLEKENFSERNEENDTDDPFFQKNAPIAQDLDEDLKADNDNDPDRRTLDEYNATTAEPEDEDEV